VERPRDVKSEADPGAPPSAVLVPERMLDVRASLVGVRRKGRVVYRADVMVEGW